MRSKPWNVGSNLEADAANCYLRLSRFLQGAAARAGPLCRTELKPSFWQNQFMSHEVDFRLGRGRIGWYTTLIRKNGRSTGIKQTDENDKSAALGRKRSLAQRTRATPCQDIV
jgi:hypothetical protein